MTPTKQFGDVDAPVQRYEYDDGSVVYATDLGSVADATVDVVDGTVIVVTDDDQHEFDLPEDGEATASLHNGVLTVEVSA